MQVNPSQQEIRMKPILRIAALTSVIILASTTLLPGQAGDAPAPPPAPQPAHPYRFVQFIEPRAGGV